MHHRDQSGEHDRPAVTHSCPLIYVMQSSQKSFQRPGQMSESFVLVFKRNFIVTFSGCYCNSSKSHFLHHRPSSLAGAGGAARAAYVGQNLLIFCTLSGVHAPLHFPLSTKLDATCAMAPFYRTFSSVLGVSEMSSAPKIPNLFWKQTIVFSVCTQPGPQPTREPVGTQSHYYSFHYGA